MSNTNPMLAAGTIVAYEIPTDGAYTDTFTTLNGIESLPAVGDETEAKEATTLSDEHEVTRSGFTTFPDAEFTGQYLESDVDQDAFITHAKARGEFKIQVTWKNGVIATFLFQTFGFSIPETQPKEWIKFVVKGKQNSLIDWSKVSAG